MPTTVDKERINARNLLREKEREWERIDDEIAVLRAKAKMSEELSDGKKAGIFKTNVQGLCVTCVLEGEVKCTTCSGVHCSVECHNKKGQCPSGF